MLQKSITFACSAQNIVSSGIVSLGIVSLSFVSLAGQGLLGCGTALAENAQETHGRLPDGRAYRIDQASGLRLSDYVAELEVTNDDLHRQIVALEDELNDRRQLVEQYEKQTGVKIAPKIKESTLVAKPALPPAKSAPISCSPDDPQVAGLVVRVRELEAQLKTAASQPAAPIAPVAPQLPPVAQTARCEYNTPANPLYAELNALKKTCSENPSRAELDGCRSENASLQAQIAAAGKVVSERDSELAKLREKAEMMHVAKASDSLPQTESRARQATQPVAAPVTQPSVDDRAVLVQGLNHLQAKVLERKNLLDIVKEKKKGVTVIQPLVTKGRVTLDDIRMNVQRFQPGQDPTGIQGSINEIGQILDDDIAVLKRLAN